MGELAGLAANTALLLGSGWGYWSWRRATEQVAEVQESLLRHILERNAGTSFGREHRFRAMASVADYQQSVPLRSYGDFEPYIQRIASGQRNVLTADLVVMFEPSSGSTAASKLIPYTASLMTEFQRGIAPWLYSLYTTSPRLLRGKHYWCITPMGVEPDRTPGGVTVGFEEDSEYFGARRRWLIQRLLAVPPGVRRIPDEATFRYVTLRFLLQCSRLSLISVWNPTFLLLLLSELPRHASALLNDLAAGSLTPPQPLAAPVAAEVEPFLARNPSRARRLSRLLETWGGETAWRDHAGRTVYEAIWPGLRLLSCWADGAAGEYAAQLQLLFPNTYMQPKGLIATEGFVTFPLGRGYGAALALTSHFFEFAEAGATPGAGPPPALAHQLDAGRAYSVILTTSGGLYRYRLRDLVEVTGFVGRCPRLRFLGKEDAVVDLFGEKLNEYHVRAAVTAQLTAWSLKPAFWMLAPEKDGGCAAHYTLFLQCPPLAEPGLMAALRGLCSGLEEALGENYHYRYCRRLGQLSPLKVFLIEPGGDTGSLFLETCRALGQRSGNVKATGLHPYQGWARVFPGKYSLA